MNEYQVNEAQCYNLFQPYFKRVLPHLTAIQLAWFRMFSTSLMICPTVRLDMKNEIIIEHTTHILMNILRAHMAYEICFRPWKKHLMRSIYQK